MFHDRPWWCPSWWPWWHGWGHWKPLQNPLAFAPGTMASSSSVSPALRERLGDEGTLGLLDVFEQAGREWKDEVLGSASDRFARTLAEESGKLRIVIAEETGKLRAQIAEQRAELLKWSFIFWIGQVAAMAALLAFMLRGLPR